MRAYGHEVSHGDQDEDHVPQPLELREATLSCNAEDLRRLHRFISAVLADAEAGGWLEDEQLWHEHFRDRDPEWTEEESDFIISFHK
jgi:hypothetical protein